MLLLRAFYSRFAKMKDQELQKLRESIAQCIWMIDELEQPDFTQLKIDSEVATDNDKIYVGRIRRDISTKNGILMYCVADNIRKGAASNAVQIAMALDIDKCKK
jgi:aspartate-semialdehyde dehydrogenase